MGVDAHRVHVANAIQDNQAYLQFLQRMAKARASQLKWGADENPENALPVDRVIGLFGRRAIRNHILCFEIFRKLNVILPRELPDEKGGELNFVARDVIRYAAGVEDLCRDNGLPFSNRAFMAGLVFDTMRNIIDARVDPNVAKPVHEYLKQIWKSSVKIAQVSQELTRNLSKVELAEYVFSGGLLLWSGKVILSLLFPDKNSGWLAFEEENRVRNSLAPECTIAAEINKFGIGHNEVSSLVAAFSGGLEKAERSIYYYCQPYYLEASDPDSFLVAKVLYFSARFHRCHKGDDIETLAKRFTSTEKKWWASLQVNFDDFKVRFRKAVKRSDEFAS